MKNYKNLNDYCAKNNYQNNEQLLDEILEQAWNQPYELINFLNNEIDEDFIDNKVYFSDFLLEKSIYDADQLWEIVDESIKADGIKSPYTGLVGPLLDKNWHSGDWFEVNVGWNDFGFIEPRDFIKDYFKNYLGQEEEKIWIKTHQFVKELEKQNQQKDEMEMEM